MKVNEIILESATHTRSVNELAPDAGGGGSGNYFQALASAWYNHDISMLADIAKKGGSPMKKIMDAQEAVEKMLQRGVIGSDGKTRKYSILYNSDFDGVVIQSADYYEYSDYDAAGNEVDSRTGRPWGPNDYMEFDGDDLDEGMYESTELVAEFDLIESIIERLAAHNGVAAEVIWEDLETLTEDELYAFAVTSEPIMENQGMAPGADFSVNDKVEELVDQYRLYDKRGWTDLFEKLVGRKLEGAEISREMEYASKFLQLLNSIRMRSDYRGQQDPKKDQELIDLSNQWLGLFNKATGEFKGMSGQGVAEAAGLYGPFTVTINTGERPQSRTKTKKFRREDDAILYAEDWLEDFPQYVFATAKVTDPAGNIVWTTNEQGAAEGGAKDRQWSNKDMERLRVATRDFDDIMASDGPEATKQNLIKKRIQTKPMAGPKGVLPEQAMAEDWQKANKRDRTAGMSQKAVNAYRRENPGSKLKTAVTTKPSKLKRGSKASKRRKSYCSRSRGQMKMHSISCAKTPDKAICKARRRWNC